MALMEASLSKSRQVRVPFSWVAERLELPEDMFNSSVRDCTGRPPSVLGLISREPRMTRVNRSVAKVYSSSPGSQLRL